MAAPRRPAIRRRLLSPALPALLLAATSCASLEAARLYGSGTEALDRGEPALAIRDLERAAELAPRASEIQNHLGIAYLEAGRRDDARRAFERAVALDCENRAARHNLDALAGGGGP